MGALAIGLDIGGTHLRAALVTAEGEILARARATSASDPRAVLERCLALIAEVRVPEVSAIGIGVPGQVHAATRRVLSGGYVDLSSLDLAAAVETATGLPVAIENDCTMALLAEAAVGAARGQANVVMMTIGTGIGGAILEQGQVLRGRGAAGQLGHIVVDPAGRALRLRPASAAWKPSVPAPPSPRTWPRRACPPRPAPRTCWPGRDDPRAARVLAAWAGPLRTAIETLVAVCDPDLVVIGGGAGAAAVAALDRVPPCAVVVSLPGRRGGTRR